VCHPEQSGCFAQRSIHDVEGPRKHTQHRRRFKAFSYALKMALDTAAALDDFLAGKTKF
jgi:hypothetical protein